MRRIENYRKGDRAETLAVLLLRAMCAVAPVPREEDFGLVDAVATLLRRDGRYLIAEDSFLVQIKSRTTTHIEYTGRSFKALLEQDLPLMIAHVDLRTSSLKLHTLGIALAHGNINDADAMVAHLNPDASCPFGLVDSIFHVPLRTPILQWTVEDTEDLSFTENAYTVLKAWIELERWNRKFRQTGMSRQFRWETNLKPREIGESYMFSPRRSHAALSEVVPLVRLLAYYAHENSVLRAPIRNVFSWLRTQDVEADPDGMLQLVLQLYDAGERASEALKRVPDADVAATFDLIQVSATAISFWCRVADRKGEGLGTRHEGSFEKLREEGFEVAVSYKGKEASVSIAVTSRWLERHRLLELGIVEINQQSTAPGSMPQVITFRKIQQSAEVARR